LRSPKLLYSYETLQGKMSFWIFQSLTVNCLEKTERSANAAGQDTYALMSRCHWNLCTHPRRLVHH
jgi:hypothetical protein